MIQISGTRECFQDVSDLVEASTASHPLFLKPQTQEDLDSEQTF